MYDYNVVFSDAAGTPQRRRRKRRFLTATFVCTALLVAAVIWQHRYDTPAGGSTERIELPALVDSAAVTTSDATVTEERQRLPFEPATQARGVALSKPPAKAAGGEQWHKLEVGPGDNLSLIFGRYGFSKRDLHKILDQDLAAKNLRRVKPGQMIMVSADDDGNVIALVQELDYLRSLDVRLRNGEYVTTLIEVEPEIRYGSALAQIEQSLFQDGQAAGIADSTIMALSDIFGWDIDFVLDVRKGDEFSVVYEEIYKDGKKIRDGKILAAEFVNRGKRLRAVYYEHADGPSGYYSDSGAAMRKAFLRAPVDFTRISSKFNLARRHPVLNTIRAHKGVDYAAPHGTPIRATADGKITHAGNKGGYGRTVVIQHGDTYSTLFAHMSRYARGIKTGARVKQGQTIGYVGKTGLATGPHLHYEFRIKGVHHNPLKVKLPHAIPLDAKYIADFRSKASPLLARLDDLRDAAKSDHLVAEVHASVRSPAGSEKDSKTQ